MQDHTIICRICGTRVARTPNEVCIKCKAQKWGYTDAELKGAAPSRPPGQQSYSQAQLPQQPQQAQQPYTNQAKGNTASNAHGKQQITKLICKNCKTLVAKTPDYKCVNCGKFKWGYSDKQLQSLEGYGNGATTIFTPVVKAILIAAGIVIVI